MIVLLSGVELAFAVVVGLFFLRFWRQTHDRFFLLFAAAFFVLALNWLGHGLTYPRQSELVTYLFVLRLGAFLLIIAAVWDKNRRPARSEHGTTPPRDVRPPIRRDLHA